MEDYELQVNCEFGMGNYEKLQPKLRFPGFEGEWKNVKLENISKISKGKGISKSDISENGKFKCIRYGELYTRYSEVINEIHSSTDVEEKHLIFSESNDIIIPASGETAIDIATASCVMLSGIALGGDINIIKTKKNGVFLAYYLNNKLKYEIAKLSQGSSVIHIYGNHLGSLRLNVPIEAEQQKIAAYLTTIDRKIELLEQRKEQLGHYKKAMMQQLFSQQIRFKDAKEDEFPEWKKKRLGKLGRFIGGGTPDTSNTEYWNGNIPWVSSSDLFEGDIHNLLITRYINDDAVRNSATKLIAKGSLLLVSRVGVGKCGIASEDLCTSQDFTNVILDNAKIYNYFLAYKLVSNPSILFRISQGTSIKGFTIDDLKSIRISLPSLPEQQKIADFLTAIDTSIETVNEQINQTKAFKKAMLQQLFV